MISKGFAVIIFIAVSVSLEKCTVTSSSQMMVHVYILMNNTAGCVTCNSYILPKLNSFVQARQMTCHWKSQGTGSWRFPEKRILIRGMKKQLLFTWDGWLPLFPSQLLSAESSTWQVKHDQMNIPGNLTSPPCISRAWTLTFRPTCCKTFCQRYCFSSYIN